MAVRCGQSAPIFLSLGAPLRHGTNKHSFFTCEEIRHRKRPVWNASGFPQVRSLDLAMAKRVLRAILMKNPKQLALVMRGARAEMKMIPRFSLTRWLSGLKARGTVRAFRAHLIAACVAAMSIQLVALTTIFFCRRAREFVRDQHVSALSCSARAKRSGRNKVRRVDCLRGCDRSQRRDIS